ncbi:Hypothetical predicted protein [Xyrichtys novacula]|uniref:Uncharacterized protein n=1 Tax=Xyrichtys novacula TaxID=13765 RepID=A0AAV1H7L3_XYRNO|nr:Hypothetical predicted protein [Xyrichtys novacula]
MERKTDEGREEEESGTAESAAIAASAMVVCTGESLSNTPGGQRAELRGSETPSAFPPRWT